MEFVWYVIAGAIGGVLGGMGMGGGTLLIPLLTIFYNINQHSAQAVNLISFIPMSIIALIIHFKNKLVKLKDALFIIIPGALSCVGGFFISEMLTGDLLGKIFGGFLIVLAIVQFILEMVEKR